jgi:hypothetical protein
MVLEGLAIPGRREVPRAPYDLATPHEAAGRPSLGLAMEIFRENIGSCDVREVKLRARSKRWARDRVASRAVDAAPEHHGRPSMVRPASSFASVGIFCCSFPGRRYGSNFFSAYPSLGDPAGARDPRGSCRHRPREHMGLSRS